MRRVSKTSVFRLCTELAIVFIAIIVCNWIFLVNSWARSSYVAVGNAWIDTSPKGLVRLFIFLLIAPLAFYLIARAFSDRRWLCVLVLTFPILCTVASEVHVTFDDMHAHSFFAEARLKAAPADRLYWNRRLIFGGDALVVQLPDGTYVTSD
jgi:hypothetical protein